MMIDAVQTLKDSLYSLVIAPYPYATARIADRPGVVLQDSSSRI